MKFKIVLLKLCCCNNDNVEKILINLDFKEIDDSEFILKRTNILLFNIKSKIIL